RPRPGSVHRLCPIPAAESLAASRSLVVRGDRAGTNLVPLALVALNPSAETAHTLTFVEDLADSALFISMALFASAVTLGERLWLRIAGYAVALVAVIRAVGGPLGMTALDLVAPLAFVAFVLVFSIKLLATRTPVADAQSVR